VDSPAAAMPVCDAMDAAVLDRVAGPNKFTELTPVGFDFFGMTEWGLLGFNSFYNIYIKFYSI
jgi:hypothetical protein